MKKKVFGLFFSSLNILTGILVLFLLGTFFYDGNISFLELFPLIIPMAFCLIYGIISFMAYHQKWKEEDSSIPRFHYLISFLIFGFFEFGLLKAYPGINFMDYPIMPYLVRIIIVLVLGTLSSVFGALSFGERYNEAYGDKKSGIFGVLSLTFMFGIFFNALVEVHMFLVASSSTGYSEFIMAFELLILPFSLGGLVINLIALIMITRLNKNVKKTLNMALAGYALYLPILGFTIYNLITTSNYGNIFLIVIVLVSFVFNRIAYSSAPEKALPKKEIPLEDEEVDEEEDEEDDDYDDEEDEDLFLEHYQKLIKLKELLDKGIMESKEYIDVIIPLKKLLKEEIASEEEDYFEEPEYDDEEWLYDEYYDPEEDFNNAIDRLTKLKDLLDNGIILASEYQEMSKSYKKILEEETSYKKEDSEDDDFDSVSERLISLKAIYDKGILLDDEYKKMSTSLKKMLKD